MIQSVSLINHFISLSLLCDPVEGITSAPRRRLLVFINPVAGQGRGETLFIQHVQPLFEMAEIEFTVTVTSELASG